MSVFLRRAGAVPRNNPLTPCGAEETTVQQKPHFSSPGVASEGSAAPLQAMPDTKERRKSPGLPSRNTSKYGVLELVPVVAPASVLSRRNTCRGFTLQEFLELICEFLVPLGPIPSLIYHFHGFLMELSASNRAHLLQIFRI